MDFSHITNTTKTLLELMNIEADVEVKDDPDLHLPILSIQAKDPSVLIGFKGETLMALSHVLKKMSDNDEGEAKLSFIVDVNDYQRKHINEIKDKAQILVERAKYYKNTVEMEPMSPYDRMIVHALYSEHPNISTSSIGQGRERRVVLEYSE